ncbi:MFS transporter [Nocardia sp. NBC_01327]|uniref:MFS transporter n=1 Tax=Nocardia sp. NBC_01327 TaxID=2903593 RepID=UPI002E15C06E|nr:MFS transporter [Nocardia sp. NBC_01327]
MADLSRPHPRATLAVVFLVMFLVSLDLSIVNVALPKIDEAFHFGPSGLSWVINAFMLPFAGLMLLGGRLADLTGRRTLLLAGLTVFALSSAWGGAAQHGWELLIGRAGQGIAAAVLAPMSLALATSEFEEGPQRAKAMAVWGGAAAAGGAVGVVLSGVLTDHLGWRWVMWVNLLFVAATVLAVLRGVTDTAPARRPRVDAIGAVLVTFGVSALVLGVITTDHHGWVSAPVLGWFVAGIVALALFAVVEARVAEPLVPLDMLRRRSLAGATVFGFLLVSGQLASFYFVAQFLQRVLGYSPTRTGLAFLPFCVGVVVGLRIAMALTPRTGPRPVLLAGGLVGAAGLLWFGQSGPSTTFLLGILAPSLVCSIGIGAAMVAMGMAAVTGIEPARSGLASGILNSARQLGGCLGLAVLVTLATHSIGDATDPAALAHGYDIALRWGAALLAAGAIVATLILPRRTATPDTAAVPAAVSN